VICKYHLKIEQDADSLRVFFEVYPKKSLEGDDYDLALRATEVEYKMELKSYDRIEDLSCQCDNVILRYGLQQVLGTKERKKKWREIMISKIKPKPFSDKLLEVLHNPLNKAIREDDVHFFEWIKERVFCNAREHQRDTGSLLCYNPTLTKGSVLRKLFKKGKRSAHNSSSKTIAERTVEKGTPNSKKAALRCFNCGSEDHLVANCPSAPK